MDALVDPYLKFKHSQGAIAFLNFGGNKKADRQRAATWPSLPQKLQGPMWLPVVAAGAVEVEERDEVGEGREIGAEHESALIAYSTPSQMKKREKIPKTDYVCIRHDAMMTKTKIDGSPS